MIGILLEISSAVLTAAGVLLQKIGLKKVKRWKDVLNSKKWILGYLLFAPAFIFYILALKYERLSIIQPLGNLSLVVLVILETLFLKDKVKKHELIAFVLFFIGVILVGL